MNSWDRPRLSSTRVLFCSLLLLGSIATSGRSAGAAEGGRFVLLVDPKNSVSFAILHGPDGAGQSIGHVGLAGWGPKWAWVGVQSKDKPQGPFVVSAPFVVNKAA
ncbi:MAG TPA: hypothetical protein VLJ39_13085, partial [Tepidisphaeraceae bacterium]|nr:hypothetical protein [Tepidisphaeraceae bacterium]